MIFLSDALCFTHQTLVQQIVSAFVLRYWNNMVFTLYDQLHYNITLIDSILKF